MSDRFINNATIKAVYHDDLDALLISEGIKDKFENGEIKCKYCGTVISRQNLFALIPEYDNLSFCCNEPVCTERMVFESNTGEEIIESSEKIHSVEE